ncbi:MAG: hypothetical protein E5Y29_26025, partial [Mesorhizobium sp.]
MKTVWRILRIVLYTLLIVVAGAIGALVVLTKTERGRDNLAGIISRLASNDDRKITVSGIDGIWSGALSVDHVVLEAAERIELARLPVTSTQPAPSGGTTTLPVSIDIKQIDLPEIALGQQLAGSGVAELAAKGSVKADAAPLAVETVLNITRHDGKQGNVDAKIH